MTDQIITLPAGPGVNYAEGGEALPPEVVRANLVYDRRLQLWLRLSRQRRKVDINYFLCTFGYGSEKRFKESLWWEALNAEIDAGNILQDDDAVRGEVFWVGHSFSRK